MCSQSSPSFSTSPTAVSAALDLLLIRSLGLLGASIGYMTQTMLLAISLYVVYAIGYKKDKKPA